MPMTPPGNSSSSDGERAGEAVDLGDAVADLDDGADAARLRGSSNWSIADLMMLTISSERMAMGSPIVAAEASAADGARQSCSGAARGGPGRLRR